MKRFLLCILAVSCGKAKSATTATAKLVSVHGSVSNILAPGGSGAQLATSFGDCVPQLRVRVFDAVSLLLTPASAVPLSTCPVLADGTFVCDGVDITKDFAALYTVVDNQPATTACAAPTVQAFIGCGYSDLTTATNTGCGGGKALDDAVLDTKDGVVIAQFVVPQASVVAFDAQLASTPASQTADGGATFAKLEQSGWLLAVVTDGSHPFARARPYLPSSCGTSKDGITTACRAYTVDSTNNFALSSAPLTDNSGMWIAQVQATGAGGAPQQPAFNINGNTNTPASYGAIDCSGAATSACYESIPQGTFVANAVFSEAPVSIIFIPQDTPATAASAGACPFQTAVKSGAASGALVCPAR